MTTRRIGLAALLWLAVMVCAGYVLQREHDAAVATQTGAAELALGRELHQVGALLTGASPTDAARRMKQLFQPARYGGLSYFILNRQQRVLGSDRLSALGKSAPDLFTAPLTTTLDTGELPADGLVARGEDTLTAALATRTPGRHPETVLVLQRDLAPLTAPLDDAFLDAFILQASLALLGIAALYLFLAARIDRRLGVIGQALTRFAEGDGEVRVNLPGQDASARLGSQFNDMATRIGEERSNLAASEERLDFALHGSNAGIWDWRIDTGHTYYSPRWKSLLGYGENELLAHSEEWLKRVHPEDLPRVLALLNAHMSGASAFFESEHRLRAKDGNYIWVLERGVALRDEGGKPYRMVGALSDISRRKEIESALQRSEEAYRSVVNAVTQAIFRCDSKGRLTFLNPAWQDLTGYPLETSLARPLTEFVEPADRDQARWLIAAAGRGDGEDVASELRLTTRAGGVRWFSLHARSLQADRGEPGVAGLLSDIDDLKKAQDALTQSNKERNTILDLSPDGFVFVDKDARVVYVNPAFLAMTGASRDSIVGQDLGDLEALARTLSDPAKPAPQFLAATDDVESLLYLVKPEKSILKWLIRHIRDKQGELQAGVIYFRNVTSQVEIDTMKSEFLSTAAHELRTPMASIYGFAELLLAREFDAATQRDLLQRIHRQTKNLTNLVNELLDLARIEARGSKSFKFKEQELAPVVLNALGSFYVPHETHSLEVDLPATLATVNIDAEKFHQAVINVLSNALKYSPGGGVIDVGVTRKNEHGKPYVGLSILDQGIGMTPEQMAHMFDRFYRADTSGAIPGTGLGMCLVKEIMSIFSGQVSVTSTFGEGTEVILWLPIVTVAPDA
jgi:PAS domain S-box-containing protein